jgi:hypothetical protein
VSKLETLTDDVTTASGLMACLTLLQSLLALQLRAEPNSASWIADFAVAALRESNGGDTDRHRAMAALSEMLVTTAVDAAKVAARRLPEELVTRSADGLTTH